MSPKKILEVEKMKITVNGKEVVLEKELTVKELLLVQKVEMPEYVTVQVNDELVDKEDFETLVIRDGASVEFLYFMGGGCYELFK
jgi:thiamine biosynthesis protein ThiS